MGVNFRQLLISELERRQTEIDSILALLRCLKGGRMAEYPALNGVKPWKGPEWPTNQPRGTPAFYEEIMELRQQGLSLRAIALQVNLSHAGVWKALRRLESRAAESHENAGHHETEETALIQT